MKTLISTKLFPIGVLLLLVLACSKEKISPSGKQITVTRTTGEFDKVGVSGASKVYILPGSTFKIEVKGSENLVSKFITKVENRELILKYSKDVNVQSDDIEVYINMPKINRVSTYGSATVELSGNFGSQEIFLANISGSGDIKFDGILKVNNLEAEIYGSGNCDLQKIIAKNANAETRGSGSITTTVTDKLDVKIAGSGNVYYYGNPVLTTEISGSGKAVKK
ncbi:head GIN domain-containing protein [Pedobacter arcticus]|uniref:head GIN domain-containing protein n=1 Tax=Pedobacter arcticus TaxID=752140 RepID=UPI0002ED72ED|nr:head GIN domain-containing protein [Pedobacter arcticus]